MPAVFSALLPRYSGILSLETFVPSGNNDKIADQRRRLLGYVEAARALGV